MERRCAWFRACRDGSLNFFFVLVLLPLPSVVSTQQQYCPYCEASRGNTYYQDYYRNFYAHYYAHYYGQWYSLSCGIDQFIQPEMLDGAAAGGGAEPAAAEE